MASSVTYSQQLNLAQLRRVLASPQGPVVRPLLKTGLRIETVAKINLLGGRSGPKRIDTGRLRTSGYTAVIYRAGVPAVVVSFPTNYARYVHDGTGIYGPRGVPIRPRKGTYLRFKPRGSNRFVYAKEVKGMRPNPFLREAVRQVMGRYPTHRG